jgi:oligoendopeptidase F
VEAWIRRTQGQKEYERIAEFGRSLKEQLASVEEALIQVNAKVRQDTLNYPAKLNVKLTALTAVVASADAGPTRQAYELFEELSARIQEQQQRLQNLIDTDVKAFNTLIRELGVPAILPGMASSVEG